MLSNQNTNLQHIFECVKCDSINMNAIDYKTKQLINSIPMYNHTYQKFSFSTALLLLALVSILGSLNYYKYHQNQIALQNTQQDRDNAFNTDYIYTTLVDY